MRCLPGYTHGQRAQPVRWAYVLLAHAWPLVRDRQRLADARRRVAELPLGSGAIAGSGFPVDRVLLKEALGFRSISANGLDVTGDRDFVAETLFALTLIGTHLSRFAGEVVLYTSAEFRCCMSSRCVQPTPLTFTGPALPIPEATRTSATSSSGGQNRSSPQTIRLASAALPGPCKPCPRQMRPGSPDSPRNPVHSRCIDPSTFQPQHLRQRPHLFQIYGYPNWPAKSILTTSRGPALHRPSAKGVRAIIGHGVHEFVRGFASLEAGVHGHAHSGLFVNGKMTGRHSRQHGWKAGAKSGLGYETPPCCLNLRCQLFQTGTLFWG